MPKCEGKFVGMDETEVEIESEDVTEDQLSVEVVIKRLCNNCGDTAMEAAATFEEIIDHTCDHEALVQRAKEFGISEAALGLDEDEGLDQADDDKLIAAILGETHQDRYEILGNVDAEPTDRYETKDRHGKPIKNPRYQRHYIGAEIHATVICNACEEEIEITGEVEESASAFEDTEHSG